MAPKTIRCLGINLPKEVKNLYSEYYRTLMKEIEEDAKKWKNFSNSWTATTNVDKMSMLPKAIYTFNAIPVKIPSIFFTELEQSQNFVQNIKVHKYPKEC